MQPWCFPALNHVPRLLQNNSCTQNESLANRCRGEGSISLPSGPTEGDKRETACSWPVSLLGWHRSPTYLHLHLSQVRGAKEAALINAPKSHMSLSEALCRASSGDHRMGLAVAAVARGRVPVPPSHSFSGMQPNAVIQVRSRRLLSNCQPVLFPKELYV